MEDLFWIGFVGAAIALLFAWLQRSRVMSFSEGNEKMRKIAASIREGANAYLKHQYTTVFKVFLVVFIILLIIVIPITRLIVGKIYGSNATVVPLVISASPYIARMVESSLKEVDAGVIEAAKSMGASTWQIIVKVLLPEAKPSLLVGAAISVTTILGYSAIAGFTGGGGLGDFAIRYGYHRYQTDMMLVTVVLLVIIVQLIQEIFMRMSRRSDKRIR